MKTKPDAFLLLALFFGVGLVISSLTHGGAEADGRANAGAGMESQANYGAVNQ